jgi:hypothetical protein
MGLSFNHSAHIIGMSINFVHIAATFFTIPKSQTKHIQNIARKQKRAKIASSKVDNLSRLSFASCSSKTSPMYSHINVPRRIGSPALTAQPCISAKTEVNMAL